MDFPPGNESIVGQSFDNASVVTPSLINLTSTGKQNFIWPNYPSRSSFQQIPSAPLTGRTLPNGQSNLGYYKMPNELLVMPSYAWLVSNKCIINAGGTITSPLATGTSCTFELDQNYFSQVGTGVANISVVADPLVLPGAQFPLAGSKTQVPWSLKCLIRGGGLGQLSSSFTLTIGTMSYLGAMFSSRMNQFGLAPSVQLSLGLVFTGAVVPPDSIAATLTSFTAKQSER